MCQDKIVVAKTSHHYQRLPCTLRHIWSAHTKIIDSAANFSSYVCKQIYSRTSAQSIYYLHYYNKFSAIINTQVASSSKHELETCVIALQSSIKSTCTNILEERIYKAPLNKEVFSLLVYSYMCVNMCVCVCVCVCFKMTLLDACCG